MVFNLAFAAQPAAGTTGPEILHDLRSVFVSIRAVISAAEWAALRPPDGSPRWRQAFPGVNDGHDAADAAVRNHEFSTGQRKLRLQNKRGKIVEAASLEFHEY